MNQYKLTRVNQVTKSAEKGNPKSMFKLGVHYAYIALDDFAVGDKGAAYLQALYWLSEAASAKVWKAYYWLGCVISDIGRITSGGPYHAMYIKEAIKKDPVYIDIVSKLKNKGLLDEDDNVDIYEVNKAFVYLYRGIFFSYCPLYNYDHISTRCFKIAAEKGIPEAEAEFGRICYYCWNNWCNIFQDKNLEEAKEILDIEGVTVASIQSYYSDAYYWLVKALEHGEEQYVDLLPELIKSKNVLDFINTPADIVQLDAD